MRLNIKTYLQKQIRLISLSTFDLFTDEEINIYSKLIETINNINRIKDKKIYKETKEIKEKLSVLIQDKRELIVLLNETIKKHDGIPRTLNIKSVVDTRYYKNEDNETIYPDGIEWHKLKLSKKIAEFESEESRALGLQHNDITYDKIIVKWKSPDVLRQICIDGFFVPVLNDNEITVKHYSFNTASAGQLRRDKIQCVADDAWNKIANQMTCGLTNERINSLGGVNCAKLMAYTGLNNGASEIFDVDIDKIIVVNDWESPVTGLMDYINPDYEINRELRTVIINHIDGCGMAIPGLLSFGAGNTMIRMPWIKGLITEFDFIRFCNEHNIPCEIDDIYGLKHDLIKEDIQIILTASQFKMYKYYNNWQEYKDYFKLYGCHVCITNYEEEIPEDTELNYQFIQSVIDMKDDEIDCMTRYIHDRINNLCNDKDSMLDILGADEDSALPYKQCLFLYPELLRDGYSRETLKAIKKRMLYDARSGAIKCRNKRLFAIPDMYAFCEFLFLGIKEPKGLIPAGEVFSRIHLKYDECDVLRSPHLYFDHAVRKFNKSEECKDWFRTNGIYTSCHDLITRILQMDCDGDHLNVIVEKWFIDAVKRNAEKMNIVPLFYDPNPSPKNPVNKESLYRAVLLAHENSGIGAVSNMLTRLWNKDDPDTEAAAILTAYNNAVIDAAKIGACNSYEDHPKAKRIVHKAIGGKNNKMPHFFQFSKNGRRIKPSANRNKAYFKSNNSTMNKICGKFDDIGHINMNFDGVGPFNWQMMISENCNDTNNEAISLFCEMDSSLNPVLKDTFFEEFDYFKTHDKYEFVKESIIDALEEKFGDIRTVYPYIVKYLFTEDNANKQTHKQMFWRVFGDIALENIKKNTEECSVCKYCGAKIPSWSKKHFCTKNGLGIFECIDCGKICERKGPRSCRCEECAKRRKDESNRIRGRKYYRKIR